MLWLMALGALAVALLLFWSIRARYFKPGFPEFLQGYAEYLVPEPVWLLASRAALGIIAIAFAVTFFLAHMIVRDNIRVNRTNFSSTSLALADTLAVIATWVMIGLAQSFLARSGRTVMRNDTRRPVLYLRSFQVDPPFWRSFRRSEHHLVRALRALGPTVAIGVPDREIPPIGAARLKVTHEHWKEVVTQLAANAQLIVLRLGKTEGFGWEMQHLVDTGAAERVLIYLDKQDQGAAYRDLRFRTNTVLPQPLPEYTGKASLIAFSADWQPTLLAPAGPSPIARIRNWMGNGQGPALREALQQKFPIEPMPFSLGEWGAMIVLGAVVLSILASGASIDAPPPHVIVSLCFLIFAVVAVRLRNWMPPSSITAPLIYVGTVLFTWWLTAASGPSRFSNVAWLTNSIWGMLVLTCYALAIIIQSDESITRMIIRLRSKGQLGDAPRPEDVGALAALSLTICMGLVMAGLYGKNQPAVAQIVGSPMVEILVLLFILSAAAQMLSGANYVIEGSLQDVPTRYLVKIVNILCTMAVTATAIMALFRISFGV
jgi:succinate dehydrogenase / fumarate reductase membrane anchor subunit